MNDLEITNRLRAISMAGEWPDIVRKCYVHVDMRLQGKTGRGAHFEQRLGMPAHDYYVGNAIKAIYERSWEWKYEKYDIVTQLTRIINSMISSEVRKYKVEVKQNFQVPLLIGETLTSSLQDSAPDDVDDEAYLARCDKALQKACENNDRYQSLIRLKTTDTSYAEIADTLQCTLNEVYQMMETIGRRARKILISEK